MRTVEPMVSDQWFVNMKPLAEPAIEAAQNGSVQFVPERFDKDLLQLDGEHPRLVHFPPAVVGAPDSRLLLR